MLLRSSTPSWVISAVQVGPLPVMVMYRSSAKARANATLSTRKAKEENLPRPELFARWKQEAAEYGFTPEHAAALEVVVALARVDGSERAPAWHEHEHEQARGDPCSRPASHGPSVEHASGAG